MGNPTGTGDLFRIGFIDGTNMKSQIESAQQSWAGDGYLAFRVRNGNMLEAMRLTASGNVGIGTTAPTSPLSVSGLIHSTTGGFMYPDGTVQTTASAGVGGSYRRNRREWSGRSHGQDGRYWPNRCSRRHRRPGRYRRPGCYRVQGATGATGTAGVTGATGASPWVLGSSGVAYYNSGNVGIGATGPTSLLQVNGNLAMKTYTETVAALGNVTGATAITWTSGSVQTMTLTGNVTLSFTGAATGQSITLYLTQDDEFSAAGPSPGPPSNGQPEAWPRPPRPP